MALLRDLEVDAYVLNAVTIVPEAIQEEYVRIPADLAYFNQRYADAYREYSHAKVGLARLEGLLRIKHREDLLASGVKVTESQVDASVQGDASYQDAQDRFVDADVARVRSQGVVDAVRAKREMLVSVGAHLRAEMGGDPSIRNQANASASYRRGSAP